MNSSNPVVVVKRKPVSAHSLRGLVVRVCGGMRRCVVLAMLALSVGQVAIAATAAQQNDAWFLDANMLNLDASNRFLGSLVATNPGKGPIYLKVSVNRLELVDGVRKVSPDAGGALRAFPQEFVLRPGESFPVRLLVDLNKQATPSQSYYVNVADVSNLQPDFRDVKGGVVTGFLLAYEALVSVQKDPLNILKPEHFAFKREPGGQFSLQNLSGQHIYINRGDACPDAQTVLVNCTPAEKFPRQTMLPGEKLSFPAFAAPVLGLLTYPKLNTRAKANLLYLKAPEVQ